ncbi:MAG: YbhB/YbcL family Raf kinase inhibitor-like protein [Pseudomonadota bacterium]
MNQTIMGVSMPSRTILFSLLPGLFFPALASAVTLTSSAFADNGVIPDEFTYSLGSQCSGSNLSPPLTIGAVPVGTQSLALTVIDPDGGNWVHWKAWNIPADTTSLPENISSTAGFNQSVNDFGTAGYGGPCPPTPDHHYVFTLYALDTTFTTEPSATQLQGAALATATLTAERSPSDNVSAAQISAARMFAYGEANYPSIFTGPAVSGQYLQYNYRYYPASGNYLAVDTTGEVFVLGPYTGNAIISVGPVESLMGYINEWEAISLP